MLTPFLVSSMSSVNILLIKGLLFSSLVLTSAQRPKERYPNIIFILADDMGWNDVGYQGSNQIPTPNIDALAYSGTILHNYYTQPLCTPSRSALMTGRHPINNGMQHGVIMRAQPWGLPLSEKILPEYLSEYGYVNRAVGKWHLGFFKKEYTPTYRGFQSHFGNWLGNIHYYTHMNGGGYDLRRNMNICWECRGKYASDLYTKEAVKIIKEHKKKRPLFLYVAHIAAHSPLEAPCSVMKKFKYIKSVKRRRIAAMITKLDESVGKIVAALKARNMLENSIIVFTNDNGGATHNYNGNVASNWPLRGGKDTLWEGGVRVPAVIWSPLLASAPKVYRGLMSVMDWLPTFISAISGDSIPEGLCEIDGQSQWCALKGDCPPPYNTLLHNINRRTKMAALRKGKWKFVTGTTWKGYYDRWFGKVVTDLTYDVKAVKKSKVATSVKGTKKPLPSNNKIAKIRRKVVIKCLGKSKFYKKCIPKKEPCLFDIKADPCEENNLADEYPEVVDKLLKFMIKKYKPVMPNNKGNDPYSNPAYWNHTWINWRDYPRPHLLGRLQM